MINEVILSIKDAEQKADEIVASAKEKARENEEAAVRAITATDQADASRAKAEYRSAVNQAEQSVEKTMAQKKSDAIASFSETVKAASSNTGKAVDFLAGEFLKKYVRN